MVDMSEESHSIASLGTESLGRGRSMDLSLTSSQMCAQRRVRAANETVVFRHCRRLDFDEYER